MKKIVVIFLLLIIVFSFLYSLLYYSFNVSKDNNINTRYRKTFISNHLLRTALMLNQTGDARFDYANSNEFSKLKIIVFQKNGNLLNDGTLKNSVMEIKKLVNKPGGITIEEREITDPFPDTVENQKLNQLIQTYETNWPATGDTAIINIFVLRKFTEHPSYAGLVKDSQTIFLFMDSIRDVSDEMGSSENAEVSTILHEFAHLLGAEHVDTPDCILSDKVENLNYYNDPYITTSFCQSDLEKIEEATK